MSKKLCETLCDSVVSFAHFYSALKGDNSRLVGSVAGANINLVFDDGQYNSFGVILLSAVFYENNRGGFIFRIVFVESIAIFEIDFSVDTESSRRQPIVCVVVIIIPSIVMGYLCGTFILRCFIGISIGLDRVLILGCACPNVYFIVLWRVDNMVYGIEVVEYIIVIDFPKRLPLVCVGCKFIQAV